MQKRITAASAAIFILIAFRVYAQSDTIRPAQIWPDTKGNHIQAHGGGIIKVKNDYYWYGEERRQGLDTNYRYVSCYQSKDLVNWTFKGDALQVSKPDTVLGKWVLERPKVYYNVKTRKFVMYCHVDGQVRSAVSTATVTSAYSYARVGVAISDKATGPFRFIRTFRPLGHESRDIGQFIDDDGSAYLIFEDRPFGFRIARLSDDYLDVEKQICLIPAHMEGGAIVHYGGLYYVIGSSLTGWAANPNKYATATDLSGPWTEFKDIAPSETKTYGSQSTMMIKIAGTKKTTVLFMGDIWKPKTQWDSRYLWMPLEIGNGKLWLPQPQPFRLNVRTGETKLIDEKK
ncbi:family 43 glycosylhydrolase [Mucilaginibacter sp. SJ]|uniref:family 43 glycosylhydrolase n=1 Tax=Mucilaginibacter sp. SJ TaxID=3029053 RepID=UPI0023A9A767|nr:family 43 glycosylhydrolase [Mucilaginibacter sp. SJ]WEA00607.1 family 43 glycosylhydrolase [Mucilaginibacter sp. SJ]